MRRLLPILIAALLVPGCGLEPRAGSFAEPKIEDVTIEAGDDYSKITVTCRVSRADGFSAYGILFDGERILSDNLTGNVFSVSINGLHYSTSYRIKAFLENGRSTVYSSEKIWTTEDEIPPSPERVVVTGGYSSLTATSVTLSGTLYRDQAIGELMFYGFEIGGTAIPASSLDASGMFTLSIDNLTPDTAFSYCAVVVIGDARFYGEYRSFRTLQLPPEPEEDYVDLGLSVLWSKCDLGASSPLEEGSQYAWGETTPKSIYNWETYKWCLGSRESIFKYTYEFDSAQPDGKRTLEAEDDAATVTLGGKWRTPTVDELGELSINCRIEKKSAGGSMYFELFSTKEGFTGRSIIMPYPCYWSSELCGCASWTATILALIDTGNELELRVLEPEDIYAADADQFARCLGYRIRPVRDR